MRFIQKMYILNFVREFVRKCPKPQNFVRRLEKFCPKMSETIKTPINQKVSQTAPLFVFIRKISSSNQDTWIIIRLEVLMKNHENKSYRYIDYPKRLKMNKDTTFHTSQKSICPKLRSKYSFDTPKLLVRISQTFVRNLSEKKHSRTKSDVFRTK